MWPPPPLNYLECLSKRWWFYSSGPLNPDAAICGAHPSPMYNARCKDTAFLQPMHQMRKAASDWANPDHVLTRFVPQGLVLEVPNMCDLIVTFIAGAPTHGLHVRNFKTFFFFNGKIFHFWKDYRRVLSPLSCFFVICVPVGEIFLPVVAIEQKEWHGYSKNSSKIREFLVSTRTCVPIRRFHFSSWSKIWGFRSFFNFF